MYFLVVDRSQRGRGRCFPRRCCIRRSSRSHTFWRRAEALPPLPRPGLFRLFFVDLVHVLLRGQDTLDFVSATCFTGTGATWSCATAQSTDTAKSQNAREAIAAAASERINLCTVSSPKAWTCLFTLQTCAPWVAATAHRSNAGGAGLFQERYGALHRARQGRAKLSPGTPARLGNARPGSDVPGRLSLILPTGNLQVRQANLLCRRRCAARRPHF